MTTRAELITLTRQAIDGVNSDRWDDTEITAVLDLIHDSEWSHILQVAPYHRIGERSVTTDSSGRFDLADLDSGTGDSEERFYRIVTLRDANGNVWSETSARNVPVASASGRALHGDRFQFYLYGEEIQVLPVANGTALTVVVNHKPPIISDLSADSIEVEFPAGNIAIVAWQAGAHLLLKGGQEPEAAGALLSMAASERERMLADLARRTMNPRFIEPADDAWEWGSQ